MFKNIHISIHKSSDNALLVFYWGWKYWLMQIKTKLAWKMLQSK